tara:strand:+ start:3300 stop:6323 length:3024 start_codon:yes stop_codon:yes gene_type:complete
MFTEKYNEDEFIKFLKNFIPNVKIELNQVQFNSNNLSNIRKIGIVHDLELIVFYVSHSYSDNARVSITNEGFNLLKSSGFQKAIIAFDSQNDDNWRLSLLTTTPVIKNKKIINKFSNPRRFSYILGPNSKINTPNKYLAKMGPIKDFDDLKSRFAVEVVNKEFYDQISSLYKELIDENQNNIYKLNLPNNDEKIKQEFVIRFIGRIIFCWFLKQKRNINQTQIISDEIMSSKSVRAKKNYYHEILEPLFFDVLNVPITSRNKINKIFIDLPYLNGGLFSKRTDDFYDNSKKPISYISNSWIIKFFELLELYNFTIDENTTNDIELSVDPEMLGRIFENLLGEISNETPDLTLKDETGSHYTPRQIVDHMISISFKSYLFSKTNISMKKIEKFLDNDFEDGNKSFNLQEKKKIIKALYTISTFDPACGSGAFPIGILQKILLLFQKIDPDHNLWISEHLSNLPENNRASFHQNLNQNNIIYWKKITTIRNNIYGSDILTIATEISRLRCFLTIIVDQEINDIGDVVPLPNLDFKFVTSNFLIPLDNSHLDTVSNQITLFDSHYLSLSEKLKKIRNKYLLSDFVNKESIKIKYLEIKNELTNKVIDTKIETSKIKRLIDWDPFSTKSTDWFDIEWMFGLSEGFDIIIGNPPYISAVKSTGLNKENRKAYREIYPELSGSFDIYIPFLLRALNLLKSDGLYTWVIPNKFLIREYAKKTKLKLSDKNLNSITNISLTNSFDASTYPIIISGDIKKTNSTTVSYTVKDLDNLSIFSDQNILDTDSIVKDGRFSTISENNIKILSGATGYQASEYPQYISDLNHKDSIPFIVSGSIDPYKYLRNKKVRFMKKDYNQAFIRKTKDSVIAKSKWDFYEKEKIIIAGMTKRVEAIYFHDPIGLGVGIYGIYEFGDYDKYALLGLLNSKFMTYYVKKKFKDVHLAGGYLAINKNLIQEYPLPNNPNKDKLKLISELAKKLNLHTNIDDNIMHEIDILVYELYGLNKKEIDLINHLTI